MALSEQAVLFRAGHHAGTLELVLVRRRVPYVKYGGLRHLEAAHVKDLLALLRLLDNPWDELAWFRVLGMLEGVGPVGARRVMERLGVRRAEAPMPTTDPGATSPLSRLLAAPPTVPAPARPELAGLRAALGHCAGADGAPPPPGAQVDRLRQWLEPVVHRRYDGAAARCGDLARLTEAASGAASRGRFVADLTLDAPVATGDLAGRAVTRRRPAGPLHRALGQGRRVDGRPPHPCGRRHVPVRPRHRRRRGAGRAAAPVLRGRHPGARRAGGQRSPALPPPSPPPRRPSRLRAVSAGS